MLSYSRSIEDPDVLHELRRAIYTKGNCILFAGAGLSAQAETEDGRCPPLWRKLLEQMIAWCAKERVAEPSVLAEITKLIEGGFLIEAGEELQSLFLNVNHQHSCLRQVLLCEDLKVSDAHINIAKTPYKAYMTTNYDCLIETAFSLVRRRALPKYYEDSVESILGDYRDGRPFIFKMHGDIDDPRSIVLGDRSYQRLLHAAPRYRTCVEVLMAMSSILFVGFGATDPDVDSLLSKISIADGERNRHWLAVAEGRIPTLKAKRLWYDRGIQVIEYPHDEKHTGLARFLGLISSSPPDKIVAANCSASSGASGSRLEIES